MKCEHRHKGEHEDLVRGFYCWDCHTIVEQDGRPAHSECVDFGRGECSGAVVFHSVDPGRASAPPRCATHWTERLERREQSIEKYENSDVPPTWFDPTYAGESWEEDR